MANCDITGTVYDQSGVVAPDARLIITPLSVSGILMSSHSRMVTAVAGVVAFTEVQNTTVRIEGDVLGYTDGANVLIPSNANATLESLTSVVTVPTSGLTIQDEGVPLAGLFGTLNVVGAGAAITQSSPGVALLTVSSGGGSGTVTSVSVVTANGVSGSVATATTTPAITLTVQDAIADGVTKGIAAFTAVDFNSAAGVISIDYTNAQKATGSVPGLLTAADWTIFNGKQAALGFTAVPDTLTVNSHALTGNVTVTAGDVGLGSVENTALSTWAGTANLTTLGTIGTGSWNATVISLAKGGTGVALSDPAGHRLMGWDDTDNAIAFLTIGSGLTYTQATHTLSASGGGVALGDSPTWTGVHTFTPTLRSSGVAPYLKITTPADTAQTLNTEFPGIVFGGNASHATVIRTGADGTTITEQREYIFVPPTYAFAGATTLTRAVSLYTASPVVGTSATFTSGIGALFEASAAAHVPLVVRGAGSQSGNLTRWTSSANASLALITSGGSMQTTGGTGAGNGYSFIGATTTSISNFGNALIFYANNTEVGEMTSVGLELDTAKMFQWNASGVSSAIDTAFARNAAGIAEVNNGTAGAGGAMLIRGAGAVNGQALTVNSISELLTLSTSGLTTDTTANLLPAGAIILSVTARVTTTITTTTNWAVGDPTTAARFSAANATLTSGTTSVGLDHLSGAVATLAAGPTQAAAAKVRITCTGSNPGAGIIRLTCHYILLGAPSS